MTDTATQYLANVKVGDKLVTNGFIRPRLEKVTKRTPKRIFCGSYEYDLTGRRIGGGDSLRHPLDGEVEALEAKAREESERYSKQQREIAAMRALPEYQVAASLLAKSEQELIERLGRERLLQIGEWLRKDEPC